MNNKNVALLNALGLLGITFVLLMASVLQVVLNELPCPLCLLQRLGFMLVMFGFMLNVVYECTTAPLWHLNYRCTLWCSYRVTSSIITCHSRYTRIW